MTESKAGHVIPGPQRVSVILADDHNMFRQGLVPLLESQRDVALLAQAANGCEAWELIETLRPAVAIVDISMPELTGIEVARRTTKAGFAVRVVVLTMHEDPAAALQAKAAGAAGYVLKDNTFEELTTAVRTVAAGGSFVTASIQAKLQALQQRGRATALLSKQEQEVAKLIALGRTSKEIGRIMGVSPRTVDTYRNRLMDKLGLRTLADVVRYAVRTGMVS